MKHRLVYGLAIGIGLVGSTQAGVFIFAEGQENPNLIAHPIGYTGDDNQHLTISVCIDPASESINELEIPVRNTVTVWNELEPTLGNVVQPYPGMPFSSYDVESVLLHEVGHCIGLAHPNLANESGLPPPPGSEDQRYAKTLRGPNNVYDLDPGADDVVGTREDLRGDDINMNWFHAASNNPFQWPAVIDGSTYTVDTEELPSGHEWVEIAGRDVWDLRGLPPTVAVMFQGIFNSETRRDLNHDDAAMIRLARTGTDRTQGTAKDYTYALEYVGVSGNCDISISMQGSSFGFCAVGGQPQGSADHISITSASIQVASTSEIEWHFNTELRDDNEIFLDRFEQ